MEKKREKILSMATELMMRYGIRSLTMDDLSRQMGLSKKTLYQHFRDKSDMVEAVLAAHLKEDSTQINQIREEGHNAIDELFAIARVVRSLLGKIHPSVLFDLEKYYPEAWKQFKDHQKTFIYNCVSDNMKKGMKDGLFRSDLHVDILTRLYLARIDAIFDPDFFPADLYPFPEVYFEMLKYHIRGIASEKGIKYLEQKIDELNKN